MTTIAELIAEADDLEQRAAALNARLREYRNPNARFGEPMQNAIELSGTTVFRRIAHELRMARKEAGG